MEYSKDLSIIIPLLNEEESLGELLAWIRSVMNREGYDYEVIFVDDGSTDGSSPKATPVSREYPSVAITASRLPFTTVLRKLAVRLW